MTIRPRLATILLCALVLVTACTGGSPEPVTPARAAAGAAPEPSWSDEFDGPAGARPDPARWGLATGGTGWGNNELEYYTDKPENASLDGAGHLVITAREGGDRRSCWYGPCRYTSARLTTKGRFSQVYGRFEARIQIPRGRGVWPAFWLLGENIDEVGFPAAGEIDVMENVGSNPAETISVVHAPGLDQGHANVLSGPVADDFHVFAVDWSPQQLAFSVDGHVHLVQPRTDGAWPYDLPFHLILNVAVGGNWPGAPDATTELPQRLVVDYVRVRPLA